VLTVRFAHGWKPFRGLQADAWLTSFGISVALSIIVLQSTQALLYGVVATFYGVKVTIVSTDTINDVALDTISKE